MNETTLTYQEMTLSSRELIVPSSSYQRPFRPEHAVAITNKFDEHLANEPKVSYSDDDIDYSVDDCRANVEQNDETYRPAISGSVENMQDYDIVFIAFPIWWGEEPRIIDTFMESYDFSGITLIPFCTSGGSGIGTAESNLHSFTTDETAWLDGRRFAAGSPRTSWYQSKESI